MAKKYLAILGGVIFIAIITFLVLFWPNLRGAWFAWRAARIDIGGAVEMVGPSTANPLVKISTTSVVMPASSPFQLPAGFSIRLLTKTVPGARMIVEDELGNLWLSQKSTGRIVRLDIVDGQVANQETVISGLSNPHGLAFDPKNPNDLYIATERALYRYRVYAPGAKTIKVLDFPAGGRHTTRTLLFGADGLLYVSIGSDCDVCFENNPLFASIQTVDVHAAKPQLTIFASGLRNAVFMAWHPLTHELWATEMGRDFLGDATPPDEINIIKKGLNYGWPLCYGNAIHDKEFDNRPIDPCLPPLAEPSYIDLPSHVAPLGLAFVPESSAWPEEWQNDLLVALHGSWNSTLPVGYKVIRIKLDDQGRSYGQEDFLTGFLTAKDTIGRPVDLLFGSSGDLYISDDKAGVIYVVRYQGAP